MPIPVAPLARVSSWQILWRRALRRWKRFKPVFSSLESTRSITESPRRNPLNVDGNANVQDPLR